MTSSLLSYGAGKEPVELRLALWDGAQGQLIIENCVRQFEKKNPHIQVRVEKPGYAAYYQKLLMQCAAGVTPDVAVLGLKQYKQFASKGVLTPLNDFIINDKDIRLDRYYPNLVNQLTYNGDLYVLPRDITSFGVIYYNKEIFDELGLPYPDGSWTWDFKIRPELKEKDFLWVLQQLTRYDENNKPTQWALAPWHYHFVADTMALSIGADFADDYKNPTKIFFNHPKIIKAYQFAADLSNKYGFIPSNQIVSNIAQTTRRELWFNKKIALYMSGNWDIPVLKKRLVKGSKDWFEWDMVNFPAYKDGTSRIPADACGYSIMKSTKHPQEAWELAKFLSDEQTMAQTARAGLTQPALRDVTLKHWVPNESHSDVEQYPKNRQCTDKLILEGFFEPRSEHWPALSTYLTDELPLLWNNEATAEEVLTRATINAQNHLTTVLEEEQNTEEFSWNSAILATIAILIALFIWVLWPEKNKTVKQKNRLAYLLLTPWLLGLVILTLGPIIMSFILSGTSWDMILPAKWVGLKNYVEAFTTDTLFMNSLYVSTIYTVISVPLGVLFSLALAMLLNMPIKGTKIFRTLFYLPCIVSSVATSLVWKKMFQVQGGLINLFIYGSDGEKNPLGLRGLFNLISKTDGPTDWLGNGDTALGALTFISFWTLGVCIIIFLARLQSLPKSRVEASILDGANGWRRFKSIIWPHLTPTVWFCLITGFIASFQVFTKAYVLTEGGPSHATEFYVLHLYKEAFLSLRMGYACALAWILFAIIFVLTTLQLKKSRWVSYDGDMK